MISNIKDKLVTIKCQKTFIYFFIALYSWEGGIENHSLAITVCHNLASFVMPNGDPWDGFFYPTLTLDSYKSLKWTDIEYL